MLAEAVESLTARLRKKLDDATAGCAAAATGEADGSVTFRFGEDAVVTLRPGPAGTVTEAGQATCTCLLAPRCLHRAAALGAAPLADTAPPEPEPAGAAGTEQTTAVEPAESAASAEPAEPAESAASAEPVESAESVPALTAAQVGAATALWHAAAEALAAGVTAGGAVVQAELLRAAHTARLAGLPRAEAAALRVVRGLRAARERRTAHRLGDLTGSFRELLYTAGVLASGTADPALTGTSRRAYTQGGSLQVQGLCREPVLSATGYGGGHPPAGPGRLPLLDLGRPPGRPGPSPRGRAGLRRPRRRHPRPRRPGPGRPAHRRRDGLPGGPARRRTRGQGDPAARRRVERRPCGPAVRPPRGRGRRRAAGHPCGGGRGGNRPDRLRCHGRRSGRRPPPRPGGCIARTAAEAAARAPAPGAAAHREPAAHRLLPRTPASRPGPSRPRPRRHPAPGGRRPGARRAVHAAAARGVAGPGRSRLRTPPGRALPAAGRRRGGRR
nr:SWIM zinc finger family protein [Streptomyces sp. MMS21 TC-5]